MSILSKLGSATVLAAVLAAPVLAAPAFATTLPDTAKEAVLRALDDEYHAEAVYAATIAKFGEVRPFINIIKAEQKHQSALLDLMKTYGIAAPENAYLTGEKPLIALPDTLQEVCAIGITAEFENTSLYEDELLPAVTDYPDITRVFHALSDASTNNHLPAFERCANGGGGGMGKGQGQGMGKGHGQNKG